MLRCKEKEGDGASDVAEQEAYPGFYRLRYLLSILHPSRPRFPLSEESGGNIYLTELQVGMKTVKRPYNRNQSTRTL